MTIMVAATIAAPYLDEPGRWRSWLTNAEQIRESLPDGYGSPRFVQYFAAIEVDGRGLRPFADCGFLTALSDAVGHWWTFSLDDGRTEVTGANRLAHICAGRNLIAHHAADDPAVSHVLFLDCDTAPPPDVLPKLLELDHPLVAGYIPTYGLRGERVTRNPATVMPYPAEWGVEAPRVASAGCYLAARKVFTTLRWRTDVTRGMTDDPCYCYDARTILGTPLFCRTDTVAEHYPPVIPPIEYRLADRTVAR